MLGIFGKSVGSVNIDEGISIVASPSLLSPAALSTADLMSSGATDDLVFVSFFFLSDVDFFLALSCVAAVCTLCALVRLPRLTGAKHVTAMGNNKLSSANRILMIGNLAELDVVCLLPMLLLPPAS